MSLLEPELAPLSLWKHATYCQPPGETMASIAARVASVHGLPVSDLKFGGRSPRYSWPRQHAMYLMVEADKWSLPRIGMFFGGMDHTTVLHGYRAHKRRNGL
jgi:chromosomal replication initiation ATPase DnaA